MSYNKEDLIKYRLEKSKNTFKEAKSLANDGWWNGAATRLYYSCFYSVIALLVSEDVNANTHNGARTEFFKRFIKTGLLPKEFSAFYSDLMNKRQESDYDDFLEFTEEEISPLFIKAEEFNLQIEKLINR
jgi:uncharacterized protein (UPF0332 family)